MKTLRYGYVLPFLRPPPLSAKPIEFQTYAEGSPRHVALDVEVQNMLGKQAIELVLDKLEGFYARLFLVPKATGGWRPVFYLSALNKFLAVSPFRMETVASVLESMGVGDWMVSLDLKDA